MNNDLLKNIVLDQFIGIIDELTENEIEDLQDLLSFKMYKLSDNGERIPLEEVKKQLGIIEKIEEN